MNNTRRLITKSLPAGWTLEKNGALQNGNRWAVLNEDRRVVVVGKTLDHILEKLEEVNDAVCFEELNDDVY